MLRSLFFHLALSFVFLSFLLLFSSNLCFGAVRRNPPRYKVAPTNVVVRIDGTNCFVRYMYDNLLHTNLVVMIEPFDPKPLPPEPMTNDFTEAENE